MSICHNVAKSTYSINFSFYLLVLSHILFVFTPIVLQKVSHFMYSIWIYLHILMPKCLSWLIYKIMFVMCNGTRMGATLMAQKLLTLREHSSLPSGLCGVNAAQCVMFFRPLLFFCSFTLFVHYNFCSSIYSLCFAMFNYKKKWLIFIICTLRVTNVFLIKSWRSMQLWWTLYTW